MIVRFAFLILGLSSILFAQDPQEAVRRATELDRRNIEISRSYTFLERQENRDVDTNGKLKKTESTTFDVTLLEGSPYRRLVARDDKPLSAKDQAKEDEKLQRSIADRRKETPEQRERRVADSERKKQKQREPLKELPEAFSFKLTGEELLNGSEVFAIEGLPRSGYRPKNPSTAFFSKIKLHLWIDKKDYQWVKADLESLDTITFGGILLRLAKGSHVTVENTRVNNEVWLPKRFDIRGSVRVALVHLMRGEIIYTFSDYKKFQADSRVVTQ